MDELLLFALCAPSGAGKTTLCRHLLETFEGFRFSVSHTTRARRGAEVDGVDYHFVSRDTFDGLVERDRFAEWAEVHGNRYGTSLDELDRARADGNTGLLFDIDHQGARQLRARVPDAITVFVLPPSMDELRRRLEGRGTDAEDEIERRLAAARDEMRHYGFFDYLIINDDFDQAAATLSAIVVAERARRRRLAQVAERLLRS
ncbi:MAG: guanylate kinase [Sandaracinaceae bacterium]|nr:guanylate kinase [Sandaracinaceae bacterium]